MFCFVIDSKTSLRMKISIRPTSQQTIATSATTCTHRKKNCAVGKYRMTNYFQMSLRNFFYWIIALWSCVYHRSFLCYSFDHRLTENQYHKERVCVSVDDFIELIPSAMKRVVLWREISIWFLNFFLALKSFFVCSWLCTAHI